MRFFASPKYSTAIFMNIAILLILMYSIWDAITGSRQLSSAIKNDDRTKLYNDEKLTHITMLYNSYKSTFNVSYGFAAVALLSLAFLLEKNNKALSAQAMIEDRPLNNTPAQNDGLRQNRLR